MSVPTIRLRPFSDSSPDHANLLGGSPRRTIHDPFCIVVWRFKTEAGRAEAFQALCDEAAGLVREQPKCLFQRVTRKGSDFKVHVGLEDSYGVLSHISSFCDVLRQARLLGRYEGVEIHGPAGELAYLRDPLQAFEPTFFERDGDQLV
jgi:hypothetical protein